MNNLTKTLLGGVALTALAAVPANAAKHSHPAFTVTALHAGHAVNKTKMHVPSRAHVTYTFGVSTSVSAANAGTAVKLAGTYYKFNSYSTLCSRPAQKVKVSPKKTALARVGTSTETYSFGCASGPTVFYGDTYTLNNGATSGETDSFVSTLTAKFMNSTGKYKGTLNLDVNVTVD